MEKSYQIFLQWHRFKSWRTSFQTHPWLAGDVLVNMEIQVDTGTSLNLNLLKLKAGLLIPFVCFEILCIKHEEYSFAAPDDHNKIAPCGTIKVFWIELNRTDGQYTAVGCVNKMGTSHYVPCNEVTMEIWSFCDCGIWLSAAYVPGKDNVEADEESRRINFDTEWQIRPDLLRHALFILEFEPRTDLFASRLNQQCPVYVAYTSYRPDPEAIAIDSFTLSWSGIQFCASPPFCIISSMLQKIKDKALGVVVMPWLLSAIVSKTSKHADIRTSAALRQRSATATNGKSSSKKTPAFSYLQKKFRLFETGCLNSVFILESWHQELVCNIHQQMEFMLSKDTLIWFICLKAKVWISRLCYSTTVWVTAAFVLNISFVLLVEIDNCEQFGEHRFVKKFMKGIVELIPALPRYAVTWDVDLVLFRAFVPSRQINIEGTVLQSDNIDCPFIGPEMPDVVVSLPSTQSMTLSSDKCVFVLDALLKQSNSKEGSIWPLWSCWPIVTRDCLWLQPLENIFAEHEIFGVWKHSCLLVIRSRMDPFQRVQLLSGFRRFCTELV